MVKVKLETKQVDGKEYVSVYLIFRDGQQDRKFLVVPFPGMSQRQKFYFRDLARKRIR